MFCSKCGTKVLDTAAFCHVCGEKINISSGADAPSAPRMPDPLFGSKIRHASAVAEIRKAPVEIREQPPAKEPEIKKEVPVPPVKQRESLIPVLEIRQKAVEIIPPAIDPEPIPAAVEVPVSKEKASDFEMRIVDYEETYPGVREESDSAPASKVKGKVLPVALIGTLLILIIFAVLTIALPNVKPFKNIRNMLGLVQTQTDALQETEQTTTEATTSAETSEQSRTVAYGTVLKAPSTPSLIASGKVLINIKASESFAAKETELKFMADFSDENETVFYIPAQDDTPEIIYAVDTANESYSSFTGAYGKFYAEAEDEPLSDAPEALLLCIDTLNFSFYKGYGGDFEARGSEDFTGTGTAHIYAMNENETETLVWIDEDTGVFVKAERDGEELFFVKDAKAGHGVQIPDYKNNIMKE